MKLCVIPARGGSKRIAGKNIRSFAGKPIIAYSIEAALQCGLFDRVIVSTDDGKIAETAGALGAEIPFMRPAELSGDMTGTHEVVKHAINWYRQQAVDVEQVCCLYATAPFVQSEYLVRGYRLLQESGKSYAFSVTSFAFPIQRALRVSESLDVEAIWPENIFRRSQDLEEAYHDAGQFYWGTAQAYLQDHVLFSSQSVAVMIPRHLVQDIDTEEDWCRAELMYKAWQLDRKAHT